MPSKHLYISISSSVIAVCAVALAVVLWVTMPQAGGSTPGAAPEQTGGAEHAGFPPATVRTGVARVEHVRKRVSVIGRLRELRRATVAAEVEGKVLKVPVEEGDRVVGGKTVLAEIDGVWVKQDLKRADANVAAAQATLDQSKLDLQYLDELNRQQSAKPKEVQDMRAQVASDEANLSAAIAERDRVQREVERLVVLAPFDGAVTMKETEVGQWVQPGDDIVEVITLGDLDAIADVPEKMIDHIKVGDVAVVLVDPLGIKVQGKVVTINPNGRNSARTFPVMIRLDDQGGRLKPGMSVTISLPVGEPGDFLTVPEDAVLYSLEDVSVWVSTPAAEGSPMPSAAQVPVKVLFNEQGRVAVEPVSASDSQVLVDGAVVVTEGAERLMPGQPLIDVDKPQGPPAQESAGSADASQAAEGA